MSAAGLASAHRPSSGLRPVQLRRDLADIADLIEFCFAPTLDAAGRSAINEMRLLSRSGPIVWALGRLSTAVPGVMTGFVWIEHGRLIGNVSVTPAGYGSGWIIANVAVHPDYRRRGIARQLMHAALDLVAQRGTFAVLQVDADNDGARTLYAQLGFTEQRTFTRWRRATHLRLPEGDAPPLPVRPVRRVESRDLLALAERVRPNERGGMGWLRPNDLPGLRPGRWPALGRLLSGRSVTTWILLGADGAFDAALRFETRLGCSTALFDLLVRPERAGELETPLLASLIRRAGGWAQPLVTEHPDDDVAASEALRGFHFRPERTLVHMIWQP